jgi:hypothetical protein
VRREHVPAGGRLRQPERRRRRQHDVLAGQSVPLDRAGRGDGQANKTVWLMNGVYDGSTAAGADPDSGRPDAARA